MGHLVGKITLRSDHNSLFSDQCQPVSGFPVAHVCHSSLAEDVLIKHIAKRISLHIV